MKNQKEVEAAKTEKPFSTGSLMREVIPLLEDYFVGEFKIEGNDIIARFFNGETFRITAEVI